MWNSIDVCAPALLVVCASALLVVCASPLLVACVSALLIVCAFALLVVCASALLVAGAFALQVVCLCFASCASVHRKVCVLSFGSGVCCVPLHCKLCIPTV